MHPIPKMYIGKMFYKILMPDELQTNVIIIYYFIF